MPKKPFSFQLWCGNRNVVYHTETGKIAMYEKLKSESDTSVCLLCKVVKSTALRTASRFGLWEPCHVSQYVHFETLYVVGPEI